MATGQKACQYGCYYESVMLFGRAVVLKDEQDKKKALSIMMQKETNEKLTFDRTVLQRTSVYAVKADKWTAKECLPA